MHGKRLIFHLDLLNPRWQGFQKTPPICPSKWTHFKVQSPWERLYKIWNGYFFTSSHTTKICWWKPDSPPQNLQITLLLDRRFSCIPRLRFALWMISRLLLKKKTRKSQCLQWWTQKIALHINLSKSQSPTRFLLLQEYLMTNDVIIN